MADSLDGSAMVKHSCFPAINGCPAGPCSLRAQAKSALEELNNSNCAPL